MFIAQNGPAVEGDPESGLLREKLVAEFEDDDIVMFVELFTLVTVVSIGSDSDKLRCGLR